MKDAKKIFDLSGEFQQAFDFFNRELFREKLEQVIITLQKHRGANGYFRANSFEERSFEEGKQQPPKFTVHEISIMPDAMYHRTDREVLATLVHEMCHLKQKQYGTPSRNGYHNRQWAEYMQAVGLEPTAFGKYDSRNPELSDEEKKKSPRRRKIHRPEGQSFHHPRRRLRPRLPQIARKRISIEPASAADSLRSAEKVEAEIYLPAMRQQCLGKTGYKIVLRRMHDHNGMRRGGRRQ